MNIFLTIIAILLIALTCYSILHSTAMEEHKFKMQMKQMEMQIEMAKKAQCNHINNMPYGELIDIVDKLINYYVSDKILYLGLPGKTDEELSVIFDDILLEICAKTKFSLSKDLITSLQFYVSSEFIDIYIKDTSRLILTGRIRQLTNKSIQKQQIISK